MKSTSFLEPQRRRLIHHQCFCSAACCSNYLGLSFVPCSAGSHLVSVESKTQCFTVFILWPVKMGQFFFCFGQESYVSLLASTSFKWCTCTISFLLRVYRDVRVLLQSGTAGSYFCVLGIIVQKTAWYWDVIVLGSVQIYTEVLSVPQKACILFRKHMETEREIAEYWKPWMINK